MNFSMIIFNLGLYLTYEMEEIVSILLEILYLLESC